ncbi:Uncharacterized conserved protein [Phaffia rhodozyma]|uniref:Ras modification protein ERF4 n=1 Tax=Phaffia rhodozyma TaxID=264483 RepID=A0A0F7SP99_PHARH|nr:Uncharacterized conserved protein [Phaffia rhodozyma]
MNIQEFLAQRPLPSTGRPSSHDGGEEEEEEEEDEDLVMADGLEMDVPDGTVGPTGSRDDHSVFRSFVPPVRAGPLQGREERVEHPQAVIRIQRDWTTGDIAQFLPDYPSELEGRITQNEFLDLINSVNTVLLEANSFRHAVWDNMLMVATMHLSLLFKKSHFEKKLEGLEVVLRRANESTWNPQGLHVQDPKLCAFSFLEIS